MNITVADKVVSGLCNDDLIFEYPQEKVWNTNGISLARRLKEDKTFGKRVDSVLTVENLQQYICKVDPKAPTRCIDGRITLGWKSSAGHPFLGAKVAGGTAHAALAHRIVDVGNLRSDLLFEDDIKYVVNKYKQIGIGFGGHLDDHAKGWNTGCGAVDNINKILEKVQLPEPQEQVRLLTKTILGDSYDGQHVVNEIIGRMLYLDALKPRYMPKENNDPKGEFLYKQTIAGILKEESVDKHEPVPQLTGTHSEVAVVMNFVPGTTFDTDKFSADNNDEIQVFGWDIWEMYEEAERLYPYTMTMNLKDQEAAIRKRIAHVTTRTILGIATTMVLTDGSLKVVLVRE